MLNSASSPSLLTFEGDTIAYSWQTLPGETMAYSASTGILPSGCDLAGETI